MPSERGERVGERVGFAVGGFVDFVGMSVLEAGVGAGVAAPPNPHVEKYLAV